MKVNGERITLDHVERAENKAMVQSTLSHILEEYAQSHSGCTVGGTSLSIREMEETLSPLWTMDSGRVSDDLPVCSTGPLAKKMINVRALVEDYSYERLFPAQGTVSYEAAYTKTEDLGTSGWGYSAVVNYDPSYDPGYLVSVLTVLGATKYEVEYPTYSDSSDLWVPYKEKKVSVERRVVPLGDGYESPAYTQQRAEAHRAYVQRVEGTAWYELKFGLVVALVALVVTLPLRLFTLSWVPEAVGSLLGWVWWLVRKGRPVEHSPDWRFLTGLVSTIILVGLAYIL
jgi:hypothetical protein